MVGAMSRPYFNKRIDELEGLFADSAGDRAVLHRLLAELNHRKTRRAQALRSRVKAALSSTDGHDAERAVVSPAKPRPDPRRDMSGPDEIPPPSPPAGGDRAPDQYSELAETPRFPSSQNTRRTPEVDFSDPALDSLLASWITLEVLEPHPLPRVDELRSARQQIVRSEDDDEPWSRKENGPRGREHEVYWFVYLGEIDLATATRSLLRLFPDESPEPIRPAKGTTTMAVVVLDREGRPTDGSTFLSSFAWGYGKVMSGEMKSLASFPDEEGRLSSELNGRLHKTGQDGELLPVSPADLRSASRWLRQRLALPAGEVSLAPVAVRVPVWSRWANTPEPELLNSFFIGDLSRVREAFRYGDVGTALRAFVAGEPDLPRTDVLETHSSLDEVLAPDRIPLAKWPVSGGFSLSMMQQAAVNHAVRELHTPGQVGINGPPGTGKTTLLRDVVAHVILQRAMALSKFDDPNDAFSHVGPMAAGRGFLHLYSLHDSLLGHEIVVASSNNRAVENISRAIPSKDAVDAELKDQLRYFPAIADRLAAVKVRDVEDGQSWGLAAAVLGKSENRSRFVNAFWWDRDRSMQSYLRGIVDGWFPERADDADDDEDSPAEVLLLEDAPTDQHEAGRRWTEARKTFQRSLERARNVQQELTRAREALHRRAASEAALKEAVRAAITSQREFDRTQRAVEDASRTRADAERQEAAAVADREAIRSTSPGWLSRLFWTRTYRDWRARMLAAQVQVETCRDRVSSAEKEVADGLSVRDRAAERLEATQERRKKLSQEVEDIRTQLRSARSLLGDRLPDRHFWEQSEKERQLTSPWLAEHFQEARNGLFAASFDLHRAFIDAAARPLRHNLAAAMMLLKGRKLSAEQEPARRSLWASLHLAVPVISTTFASTARLFGPLGREQLGWLLIDEAGQAEPQDAIGAIWRSQRVIAIGDPLQIEPVVTLPQRLINAIFHDASIDADAWSAPRNSVQSLADRASWFGTALTQDDGELWVGAPLRVHRRCESPMFEICNRIAYDGLMVQATRPRKSRIGEVLGDSVWFDVPGETPGHWSEAEGELAARLLDDLLGDVGFEHEIFFITPFRLCMQKLRERLGRAVAAHPGGPPHWQWCEENVGTIHTFQGREAEAVVLVLGAPSQRNLGARRWAGSSPNLLNVAVSRAKQRLYVVGSREAWRDAGIFRSLAGALPRAKGV